MAQADSKKIEEVLSRGVEAIYPSVDFLKDTLTKGKKLKIYHGIDPTGPTLHLGHMVQLLKLRQLQDLGCHIILMIGDFTAMIGDPTDKAAVRKPLTRKQVLANCKNYKDQVKKILDGKKTEFKFNSKWLAKMSFTDVVNLASEFTVQQLLERDMFNKRMKEGRPIHLHEFLYPIMQGYDSVAMDVDMETGGSDQTFNMLAGRTLMKSVLGKEKIVLTTKLLEDPNGNKMGKSEGNMVALNDSPQDMYGKVMSWPDEFIVRGFEIATQVPMTEVKDYEEQLKSIDNPRDIKMALAKSITATYYGEVQALQAESYFKTVFQQKSVPQDIAEIKPDSYKLIDVLTKAGLTSSNSEVRRLLQQGGIKIDDKVVKDENLEVKPGQIIQKGKRHFVKVT